VLPPVTLESVKLAVPGTLRVEVSVVPLEGTPDAGQAPAARKIVAVPGAVLDTSGETTVRVTECAGVCAESQPIDRPMMAAMVP